MHLGSIVIGYCLESVLYAISQGSYHVQSCNLRPLFFEKTGDFSIFGQNSTKTIWQRLKYYNGLIAKNLDYENLSSIRISGNTIKFFDTSLADEYTFDHCHIFDTCKVLHENDIKSYHDQTYRVLDDFKVSRISPRNSGKTSFSTGDNFVKNVYMYNSGRVEGTSHVTDVVCVSTLKRQDLHNFDYSDTMAKFKLRDFLSKNGYEGRYEKGKYKNGNRIYKKINLEHLQRIVFEEDNNLYLQTKNVTIEKVTLEKIIENARTTKGDKYSWNSPYLWSG